MSATRMEVTPCWASTSPTPPRARASAGSSDSARASSRMSSGRQWVPNTTSATPRSRMTSAICPAPGVRSGIASPSTESPSRSTRRTAASRPSSRLRDRLGRAFGGLARDGARGRVQAQRLEGARDAAHRRLGQTQSFLFVRRPRTPLRPPARMVDEQVRAYQRATRARGSPARRRRHRRGPASPSRRLREGSVPRNGKL